MDESLPNLTRLEETRMRFNLILLSAVWMHIPPNQRPRAMQVLAGMLSPEGVLSISLRRGAPNPVRYIFAVDRDELLTLGSENQLAELFTSDKNDLLGRDNVTWTTVILQNANSI